MSKLSLKQLAQGGATTGQPILWDGSKYAPGGEIVAPDIKLTPGSAPGTPAEGQVYYDSTAKGLKYRSDTAWVDCGAQSNDFKDAVKAVATTLPTYTRTDNTINGTGVALGTIDGVTLTAGDRLLLNISGGHIDNGIYRVVQTSSPYQLIRSSDADTSAKVTNGMLCFSTGGSSYSQQGFLLTSGDPVLNNTAITFSKTIPDASATVAGIVSTGTQTFGGAKTFNSSTTIASASSGTLLDISGVNAAIGVNVYANTGAKALQSGALAGNGIESFSQANNGIGVWGYNTTGAGAIGVKGTSSSITGYGVYGLNDASGTNTTGAGVYGEQSSASGVGVRGKVTGASGIAGRFEAASPAVQALGCVGTAIIAAPYAAASDVYVKAGSSTADGSVGAGAKLLSARTGIGGTEVEYFSVSKSTSTSGTVTCAPPSTGASDICVKAGTSTADGTVNVATKLFSVRTGISGTEVEQACFTKGGVISQQGTDSSASPGSATINKATGISAMASGASTCTITNSLVTTTCGIHLTWLGDHGAANWWVTRAAGSFVVNLSSAAAANTSFYWTVSTII